MTPRVAAINCTGCGAALSLRGGHRVRGVTCSYCGAVMDSHDDYRLLARHQDLERPASPFTLGMEGRIKGVAFTVIGTIAYHDQKDPAWGWVSHQLFSPTHGYAWLTWHDGHVVFSRRTRELPDPPSPRPFRRRRKVEHDGRVYRMFECYNAVVGFVEGELTWVARRGDVGEVAEAIAPPFGLEYEAGKGELEHALSEYLQPDEARRAFGLDSLPRRSGIHPLQPFEPGRFQLALARVGRVFAGIALVAVLVTLIAGRGTVLLEQRIERPQGEIGPFAFDAASPDRLLQLTLESPVENSWVSYDIRITDDDDRAVLILERDIEYYEGYEGGERWTEGSTTRRVLFKVPEAGRYALELEPETEGGAAPPLGVEIREGVMVVRYFVALLALSLVAAVSLPFRRWRFERARWDEGEE